MICVDLLVVAGNEKA